MKFHSTGPTRGDCTAPYEVTDFKAKTVGEFIEEVLKEKADEWGYISVDGVRICEYKHGLLIFKPKEMYLNREITKISAEGGWSRMDYSICTTAANEPQEKNRVYRVSLLVNGEQYKLVESENVVVCKKQCDICEKFCKSLEDRICERLGGGKRSYFKKV